MDKDKELEKICKPVVDYLKNNYNPHCTVVIEDSQIKLVEDVICIPKETAPEGQVQGQVTSEDIKSELFCILNTVSSLIDKALPIVTKYDELFTSKPINNTTTKGDSDI